MASAADIRGAGAPAAAKRLTRIAREASQAAAQLVAQIDADVVGVFTVPIGTSDLADIHTFVAEAALTGDVTLTVTRTPATTAP